ncbi:MAG: hypothetical protein LBR52_04065 [Prevotellaceae bacterium]|jgi:hypothetical protein|nr:hypothetical protein [Prevotellaceae bacterium]
MYKGLITILLLLSLPALWGQQASISENEKRIAGLFDSLKISSSDSEKKAINDKITKLFTEELQNPESFSNSYSSLNFVGKVLSDDGKVKIYTWNYPLADKTYHYGGFIQYKTKDKTVKTIPLTVKNEAYQPLNNKRIPANDWYGALYYRIIPVKYRKENYYVLLGWARNNAASEYKLIEILNFDAKGNALFGKLVLKQKNKTHQRFVLEYNAEAKISLAYDSKMKKIIFDHLIPLEPVYTNVYSYYGPDFTYDAFRLKKGKWEFEENIDVKNKE